MSDLRTFIALQARLYEFLEQQDETTLQAVADGAARLAVVGSDDAGTPVRSTPHETSHPAAAGITTAPSSDPLQAALDLLTLTSVEERRKYLTAANLPLEKGLRKVARNLDLKNYSKPSKDELIELLIIHRLAQAKAPADKPKTPAPSSPQPVDDDSEARQHVTARETRPAAPTTQSSADTSAIASRLREIETEEEGAAFLHEQRLDREGLLAVATELGLTRVDRLRQPDLEKKILKQAIGARRKFAGLRKW